ncbi:MAG TPA: hydantoinase/oxoprolinase family protein [Acetobacteraceae bacterium]|nr:hydantoinase/oxoprolinase family protein [Acetobacteraceae bacterium]
MALRLGVDIGGTFTDFALLDPARGTVALHKRLTTPEAPERAVIEGAEALLGEHGFGLKALDLLVHGTTLITNATIERRGARTGFLVTRGFADVIEIGREQRYDLFDLRLRFPDPLVPCALRREVPERVLADGTVEAELDEDAALSAVADLVRRERIEALAVGLLHSYAHPAHERRIGALVAKAFPELKVSLSAEVCPFMREYERWTTTIVNAYTQPLADRYLAALEGGLAVRGFRGTLRVMTANGGSATAETARRFPVRLIESGPAAGVLMTSWLARQSGMPRNLLSFDLGGTTAKGALVRGTEPLRRFDLEVARVHAFRKGSGLPLKIPVMDMIEIGSGGGSIAARDRRGLIAVGPRSAGAAPGPACYALGGQEATLTDANLVLGFLNSAFFLGGRMRLDPAAARAALEARIGAPLGLDAARAAWGIHETANEDIARAFRVHAAERGFDYRGCAMIAFGGGGPVHATRIARKLRVPEVILPAGAGVMSAIGLLVAPLRYDVIRSDRVLLDDLAPEQLAARFATLESEAAAPLRGAGLTADAIATERRLDLRYHGQGYEIEVALPPDEPRAVLAAIPALFAEAYARIFGITFPGQALEIVNWKASAEGPSPALGAARLAVAVPPCMPDASAHKGERPVYDPATGAYRPVPVLDRYALRDGDEVAGPALIEENESTCVLGTGDRAAVDAQGTIIVAIGGAA